MDSSSEICVYHSDKWRSSVQGVCNQLRGRYVPNKYLRSICKVVCCCNKERFCDNDNELFHSTSCSEIDKWYTAEIFEKNDHGLDSIEFILKKMLLMVTPSHKSILRFLVLVQQLIMGNSEILKRNDVLKRADKRQKYEYKRTEKLPVKWTNIRYVVGKAGRHLKPLCKKYNCEIHIFHRHLSFVECTVLAKSANNVESVVEYVQRHASSVNSKRLRHDQQVEEFREKRRKRAMIHMQMRGPGVTYRFIQAIDDSKEFHRETYYKKQKHIGSKSKKQTSVLDEGSRCKNCLMVYSKELLGKENCRHHPGYLSAKDKKTQQYEWSCCGETIGESDQSEQIVSHLATGCEIGLHNWRLKNRANKSRKQSTQNYDIE